MKKSKGFTPASDYLIARYGEPLIALVYGKVWRFWDWKGSCFAAQETIGNQLGVSPKTVGRRLAILEKDGFIKRVSKTKGTTVEWIPTGKISFRTTVEEIITPDRESEVDDNQGEARTESPNPADSEADPTQDSESDKERLPTKSLKAFNDDGSGDRVAVAMATLKDTPAITIYIENILPNITQLQSEDAIDLIDEHGDEHFKEACIRATFQNARTPAYVHKILQNAAKYNYDFDRGKPNKTGGNKKQNGRKPNGKKDHGTSSYGDIESVGFPEGELAIDSQDI